ncbi:MAG: hypothetical protein IKT58_05725, partial [Oscillospiraceae bacterium]|nr:hypothetical protein [Oscillospiraceae bacterium]
MKNIEEYKQKLRTVGDSIRRKTGKEDKLTLEQMATEIEGIEVGGSNADYVALIDDSIVNFK